MKFIELEKVLLNDGWYKSKVAGGHYQYKHKTKPGKITISRHAKDVKKRLVYSVLKQAKINKNNLKNL